MTVPRFDVTTLGEVMVRLSVPTGHRLEAATNLDLYPGGAEGNVMVALARLGRRVAWLSQLPSNPLGRLVANHLRVAGVDVNAVVWSATGRVGVYFTEFATPPRPTQVVYDRADSCAARLRPDQVDWDTLLDTRLVHLTGITPALSPSCRAVATELVQRAHAAGIPVSVDINYRSRLWSETEARACLTPLIQGVDLLFCSQGDAGRIFKATGDPAEIIQQLAEQSQAHHIIVTVGADGVYGWDGTTLRHEPALPVQIVDRLGAGDALAAGVIHGWLDHDLGRGLQYGVVLAALILSQYGDMLITTPDEVDMLLARTAGAIMR